MSWQCRLAGQLLLPLAWFGTAEAARPLHHRQLSSPNIIDLPSQHPRDADGSSGSFLEVHEGEKGEPGPVGLSARNTVLMSAQLSLTMDSLQSQAKQICEQVLADKRRIEQITGQLDEDEKMRKALQAQIKELQEGRQTAVKEMTSSMSTATKSGHELLQKGWSALLQIEADSKDSAASSSEAQKGSEAASEDGPEPIWEPVNAKSIQAEDLLNLLNLQDAKVSIQIEQGKLDKEELTNNINMHKVMLKATLQQLRTVHDGRQDGLISIAKAFADSYKALQDESSKSDSPREPEDTGGEPTKPKRQDVSFVTSVCEAQIAEDNGTPENSQVETSTTKKAEEEVVPEVEAETTTTQKAGSGQFVERADDSEDVKLNTDLLMKKESHSIALPRSKALFAEVPRLDSKDVELAQTAAEAEQVSDNIVREVNRQLREEKERLQSNKRKEKEERRKPSSVAVPSPTDLFDDRADDSILQVRAVGRPLLVQALATNAHI
mmetsp:Transcript_9694/g.21663  ORF Transcript_9694/g.21663 Transcript_9694/m.21663 type:complete len:493 (+) Transcript_9694:152-1630(+)